MKKYAESTYVILFTRIGSQESHSESVIRRTRYRFISLSIKFSLIYLIQSNDARRANFYFK